jgi:hypothetical protein
MNPLSTELGSRLHPCGVHKNEACVWSLCVGEFGTLQGRKDW